MSLYASQIKDDILAVEYLRFRYWNRNIHLAVTPYPTQSTASWDFAGIRFDPDRRKTPTARALAFRPFGAGPRKCIGDFFALVEIQMHLMMFAKEFPCYAVVKYRGAGGLRPD